MTTLFIIRFLFNADLGHSTWTLERADGKPLLAKEGIVSLGFATKADAEFCRDNNARLQAG